MTDKPITTDTFKQFLLSLQDRICEALIVHETSEKTFLTDSWTRPEGGGGRSRVIEGGETFDRGGVNFSHVTGASLPAAATQHRPQLAGRQFEAMGVSLVIHPRNPHIPTTHMNIRLFFATKEGEAPVWWFGGGFDLTPYYPIDEDVIHWHQTAKNACDKHGDEFYSRFKKWCDEYFYLKHRDETRGVGGIFFDDFNELSFNESQQFTQSIGDAFLTAYLPIIEKRISTPFTEQEKAFQLYRRGRYVEFNLVYDRGTLFGLQTGGRTESILMSLPTEVNWRYNWEPTPGSPEAKLYERYLKPQDWLTSGSN